MNSWNNGKRQEVDKKVEIQLQQPPQSYSQYFQQTGPLQTYQTSTHSTFPPSLPGSTFPPHSRLHDKSPQSSQMLSVNPFMYYSSNNNLAYSSEFTTYNEEGLPQQANSSGEVASTPSNASSMPPTTSVNEGGPRDGAENPTQNSIEPYPWGNQMQYNHSGIRNTYGTNSPRVKYEDNIQYYRELSERSNSIASTELRPLEHPSYRIGKPGDLKKSNSETRLNHGMRVKAITKRSRMGCLTCRMRKKRCCEKRPKCTECTRLGLNCVWPTPGTEHKNKPKDVKSEENTMNHEVYGKIKVLRGVVEYRSQMSS